MPIHESPGLRFEENVPVPMRDGTLLRANIWRPERPGRFPAVLERTPYGKAGGLDNGGIARFVHAGFAFVTQDIRGRYASAGRWIPFSEPATGDAEDGHDTIEWLAAQPWCDGRVGTTGSSYCGWTQWQLAPLRPPHHAAMSARTIPVELDELDWNGGFKAARRLVWWFQTMSPDLRRRLGLPPPHTPAEAAPTFTPEALQTLFRTLPLASLADRLPPGLAESARAWLRDPRRRPWGFRDSTRQLTLPNFDITGWFDHCNGSIGHFTRLRRHGATPEARTQSRLLIGPWNHISHGRRRQGAFDFGPAAEVDVNGLLLRWFDRRLRGTDNGTDREPPVRYFALGINAWREADDWPPPGTRDRLFHARAGGRLTAEPPPAAEPPATYATDPSDPTPSLCDASFFTAPADRRRLDNRADILRYVSEPLEEELEIAGHPEVVLYASSTAPDTDFFVRLADDAPDGPDLELCYGMTRARYRDGFECEKPLIPGEPVEIRVRLGPTACRFLKGHRIRLEIAGFDFPLHDRNHQTGGNDLFETELRPAVQTVFHSPVRPTRLTLPVVG